ncbi:hypothetical protein PN498_06070 [Oscillatoria sp. CS-180]|uniref:hypothetical protein n=1 Tax=Oscillatoria sp. CS-180 TaxID=3021720 RepID=UPI00232F0678|nr:hypothetical protein [Oscillatoria sp. CS-180]MDB9525546.1 hypothetical protein [Oscillatoria sp. CS-180]
MPLISRTRTRWLIVALALSAIAFSPVRAQSQELCEPDGNYESPSETLRTVELPELGVSVSIPENYRTMKLQNGAVQILHPDDFEWIQCVANGGRGGGGYYFEMIQKVMPDPTLNLQEQASRMMGSDIQIMAYQQNGLEGYIVNSVYGYNVAFLGTIPGYQHLIEVSAGCDCEIEVEAVTDLLSEVRPL